MESRWIVVLALLALAASTNALAVERRGARADVSARSSFLQAADEWARDIRYCHSVGDPHFYSFWGRYTDYYQENEFLLYQNTVPYKEQFDSMATRVHNRPATQSHFAYRANNDHIAVGFRYSSAGCRQDSGCVNGMELYKNGVLQSQDEVFRTWSLGHIYYQYFRIHWYSLIRITNTHTGFRADLYAFGGLGFYYYWPHWNVLIWANTVNANGICRDGNFHLVTNDKSMMPHPWMAGRPEYYGDSGSKEKHETLLKMANGNTHLIRQAKDACEIPQIASKLYHDCAVDWIVAPDFMRAPTVKEYIKATNENVGREKAREQLEKIKKSAEEAGRVCTTESGARFFGGGYHQGSANDVLRRTQDVELIHCRRQCHEHGKCQIWTYDVVNRVCLEMRTRYTGFTKEFKGAWTSGFCKKDRDPGQTCKEHSDCGKFYEFDQMCLYGRCSVITGLVGGSCYENSQCRFGLKCNNYACA